jgi:hypothetical protein
LSEISFATSPPNFALKATPSSRPDQIGEFVMCCVLPAAFAAASRAFLWLLGGLITLTIVALPVRADEIDASPVQPWCIARSGEQLDCAYDLLTCSVKAFSSGGYCMKGQPVVQTAATAEPAPPPRQRKPPRRKPATADKDKLFKEFVRWKEAGGR